MTQQTDIGIRQQEAPAWHRFLHVRALRSVAPKMFRRQPCLTYVVANLNTVGIQAIHERAIGDIDKALHKHRVKLLAVTPYRRALFRQVCQRLVYLLRQCLPLQVNALFP